jgi:hypothetical protein
MRNALAHGLRPEGLPPLGTVADSVVERGKKILDALVGGVERTEKPSAGEIVEWFFENYEDPANGVPYETAEGGYVYYLGGPYDPWEVIGEEFPDADDKTVEAAVSKIVPQGFEWIRKGQYGG